MWKYVWFLSATPYGLLLFIIQTVAAAAECENEFFFFEVKMGELLDATCSFHSITSYSPETYIWLLPIHPFTNTSKVHFSIPPIQPWPPRDFSALGTWSCIIESRWPTKVSVWIFLTDDSCQKKKKSQRIPALVVRVAFPLLNHVISSRLIRHMEALKRVTLPPQARLVQLRGNGKCRVALLQTIRMRFAEILGGSGRKWFAE